MCRMVLPSKVATSTVWSRVAILISSQRKGYACKTIGIKLRYDDFKIATRDQTLEVATFDGKTIRHIAGLCLKRVPLEQRLRLLGVRASNLIKLGDLAENQSMQTRTAIKQIADDQLF